MSAQIVVETDGRIVITTDAPIGVYDRDWVHGLCKLIRLSGMKLSHEETRRLLRVLAPALDPSVSAAVDEIWKGMP